MAQSKIKDWGRVYRYPDKPATIFINSAQPAHETRLTEIAVRRRRLSYSGLNRQPSPSGADW
ncbi:MAG: hypothetical protein KME26_09650 [Oscillatoria princeps RMCB-10]|nr:hypothetical protein [Oscillatoria princeps RMCB-10]